MNFAEYYTKQNVIALNIQLHILVNRAINELLISKPCLLNRIRVCVKREKKTENIKDFHIYKIVLYWLQDQIGGKYKYTKPNERRPENGLSEKWNEREKGQGSTQKERNSVDTFSNENYEPNKFLNKKSCNGKLKETYVTDDPSDIANVVGDATYTTPHITTCFEKNHFGSTAKTVLYENNQEVELQKIKAENIKEDMDISMNYSIEKVSSHFIEFSFLKRIQFCKYICVPSSLSLSKIHIKSFHLKLKNERHLSGTVLLNIFVNKKDNTFFKKTENVELQNMLFVDKHVIFCNTCNTDIITYSNNTMIMPYLTINVNSFFENAFCEECTSFSYDGLTKYANNTIAVYPNSLVFRLDLISQNNLEINKGAVDDLRNVLFCHSCHSSVGYLERDNKRSERRYEKRNEIGSDIQENGSNTLYTVDYCAKKKNNDMLKDMLFNITHEQGTIEYIKLEDRLSDFTKLEKREEQELIEEKTYKRLHFFGDVSTDKEEENRKEKKEWETESSSPKKKDGPYRERCGGVHNTCCELGFKKPLMEHPFQVHLLKHKIQLLLNNKNIFEYYSDVLFLNEYMLNKCEKYNTCLFYVKCKEKRNALEIKIFIKNMYICRIEENIKRFKKDNPYFQKVLKVMYCQKKEEDFIKGINYELINVSKEIYEDTLKMLATYAFVSDLSADKMLSYLHLVQ